MNHYRVDVFAVGQDKHLRRRSFWAGGDKAAFKAAGRLIDKHLAQRDRYAEVFTNCGNGWVKVTYPGLHLAEVTS